MGCVTEFSHAIQISLQMVDIWKNRINNELYLNISTLDAQNNNILSVLILYFRFLNKN